MLHAPRHSLQTRDIERNEHHIEADESEPEGRLAPSFVQPEAEGLREPVGDASKGGKYHTADDDVMEVSDQEGAIVQQEIGRRDGKKHASHAADTERHEKSD